MAEQLTDQIFDELGLLGRKPPELFRSPEDVKSGPVNGYAHVLRRTWNSFDKLLGVLAVSGRPTLYVQGGTDRRGLTRKEQRRFWSSGLAPMLVRVTPTEVQVYSSLRAPAMEEENVDDNERLIRKFNRLADALELRQFMRSVEAGTVYNHYAKHFDPEQAVDQRLVQNLKATRDEMSKGKGAPGLTTIHRMLGRVLFVCYLEARRALVPRDFGRLGAGSEATFRQLFELNLPEARRALSRLFIRLGRYFRGNLFDDDLGPDLKLLRDGDLRTLRNLLSGADLFSGQQVMPFHVYDFEVIPIETISAVYEDFIRAEGTEVDHEERDQQRKKGAYYTPPKLVEFVMDFATSDAPDLIGKRALDPGCGSGVFLVSIFNRIAEAWIREHEEARNGERAEALADILRTQICGVDVTLIACQATCFSLYMAMLDFLEPKDIRRLGKGRLPPLLLRRGEKKKAGGPQTVIEADFLSFLPALYERKFHLVVGNPPWVARGNVEEDSIGVWQRNHPPDRFPLPARQVACAFMWEVAKYLEPGGRACLLLPAKILFGDQVDEFQLQWFSRHRVDRVAQLSDLRFFLFPTAIHPTVAIRFAAGTSSSDQRIEYISPKASYASLFDNVIVVEADDRKTLLLKEVLESAKHDDAAACWFAYNWASSRERAFLSRLRELKPLRELVGAPEERKRWNKGQGFQPHGKDEGRGKSFWGSDQPFVDSRKKFDLLLSKNDTKPIGSGYNSPHRVRDERIFRHPLVLFNQGYTKIAYAPFDVLFKAALQAISGPKSDAELLKFLAAALLSPLADYFLFHMSSRSVYRYALLNEVLRFPFPLPENAPGDDARASVRAAAKVFDRIQKDNRFGRLGHPDLIAEAKLELTAHVYSYFDVSDDEKILIEDAVTTLKSSVMPARASHVPTLDVPTERDRELYADTLMATLRRWTGHADDRLSAKCALSEKEGIGILTIAKRNGTVGYIESQVSADLDQVLARLKKLSPDRYGSLVYLRNLAVMERDRIHIVKPLIKRFWLRSSALNDADVAAVRLLEQGARRVS